MPGSARPAGLGPIAAAAAALLVAACDPYVQGNGVYHEEDRTPSATIHGVHVQDGIEATVVSGATSQKVVVSGDANFTPYIKTQVVTDHASGPVLRVSIDFNGGTGSATIPPRAVVQLAELRYVYASGRVSHVDATGVATPILSIEAYDRSDVVVAGAGGKRIAVAAAGASVDAGSYPASEGALVELSSGARVELHSDGPVAGTVHGGCTLDNQLGAGTCTSVVVPAGETPTLLCAP